MQDTYTKDNDAQLHVRVPSELVGRGQLAAKAADLTFSQWVRQAMREKLARDADPS